MGGTRCYLRIDPTIPLPANSVRIRPNLSRSSFGIPGIEADEVRTFDEVAACEGSYGLMKEDEFINEFMSYHHRVTQSFTGFYL